MPSARILALAGSTRRESFNKRLLVIAAAAARSAGADVTHIDLADYELPLFNQDDQQAQGLPDNAKKLKRLFVEHRGLLIASPEYNSSITPLLKNTIDWVSRAEPGESELMAFQDKAAALISASPGALGGLRGLVHLRSILGNIGVLVVPRQAAVSQAHAAFNDDGSLKDARQLGRVEAVARDLVELVNRLNPQA